MDKRREYFESSAEDWDKEFTAEDLEILAFLIDSLDIQEGSHILDLGCGTGIMFDMLRRKAGSGGMVVGVDFSSRMVKKARKNFPFKNICEVDGDVENLPIRGESIDYAISLAAFAHFANLERVMDEVSRVLKSGGQFHVIHLLGSRELEKYHHEAGGPVADDHLPTRKEMLALFEHGHFINTKIADHPGFYHASGVKG